VSTTVEREIPPPSWSDYCESFTGQHRGWLVRFVICDGEALVFDQPLAGVRCGRAEDGASFTLLVGRGRNERSVVIDGVTRIFERGADGAVFGLRIENHDESALLTFRVAVLPEEVDGLADFEL
jgi:hypothetical protein